MKSKAFTLIELVTVVFVLSLLVAISVVAINKSRVKARDARRREDISTIAAAVNLFYQDNNSYPCSGCGCTANTWQNLSAITELSNGGYLSPLPRDPWVNPNYYYQFCNDSTNASYAARARLEMDTTDQISSDNCGNNTSILKSSDYKVGGSGPSYVSKSAGY